jgi:sigma-B regulation protein RsbU (phosphoserine phosphatase)
MPLINIELVVVVSLLSAGLLATGLAVGYWRGRRRGLELARLSHSGASADLDKLAGVGRAILSAPLRVDALCEIVYQQATRIVDTRDYQLGLFESSDYVIKVWLRKGERLPETRFDGAANSGIIGWVRTAGRSLLVNDYLAEWETLPARPVYESINPPRSSVFVPLIAGGDIIGVIAIHSDVPYGFNEEAVRLLTVLSSQAGGAIRNAQLYEQERRRADQLRVSGEVVRQITAVQPLQDLFRQIVTLLHDTFRYYSVSILTPDENTGEIKLRASSHKEFGKRNIVLKPGEGLIGWAYEQAQTVNSPDVTNDPRYIHVSVLDQTKSEIAVPLIMDRRVLGILDVQSDQSHAFKNEDVFVLESLAGQLALALSEAKVYEAERRQTERINAMAEASRAVVSILDINDLLDEVVDLVADYFGYDRVHLFLRSGSQVVFRSGSGVHSGKWAIDHLAYDIEETGFIPWVARNGKALCSGDVRSDERFMPAPGVEDTRSEMTVPISIGQRVLGVFDIQSTESNAFDDEDVRLVQALADTVAVGLRNAGLFATETRRRVLAETLREVSTVLASSLELPSVLDGILLGLERVVDYDAAVILLRADDESCYTVSAVRGLVNEGQALNQVITSDEKLTERIQMLLYTMEAPEEKKGTEETGETKASTPHDHLYVGLQVGGKDIGILAIDRIGPEHFSPEDVEIINTFANQAAVAIANAQLYTAQREEAWVSSALLQVAEATGHAANLDEVLSTVAQITPLLVGVEWCAVFLADSATFRVVEIEGVSPEIADKFKGYIFYDTDWPPLSTLRQTGKPVLIGPDTPQPIHQPMPLPKIRQAVLLPLYAKGGVTGALMLGQRDGTEFLTQRKIELLSGIANQAALAIEGAQLLAAQQEEAWVTAALLSVAESVNSTLGLQPTLETVVRLTPMLAGVTRCAIVCWESDSRQFTAGASWGISPEAEREFLELTLSPDTDRFIALLATSHEPVSCGEETPQAIPEVLQRLFEVQALLGLPLIAQGTLVGAMLVDHPAPMQPFNQRRMNILTGIAQQVALALETARLQTESTERQRLERELEVARGIQHSFLPQQLPQLPGWDLAACYRAARQVGGDFYDLIPLKSKKWGIVIADVADKGVPAALFMALSRTLIRAAAFSRDDPGTTLTRVNELLLSDSRSDLFVTAWFGVWDPETGVIEYSSAGHNPPLVIHADGHSEELKSKGIALGVIETVTLEKKQKTLGPGDVLVAYTDGATEARRSDDTEFGMIGLQSTVTSVRQHSAIAIIDRIVQAIDTFTAGEAQFDDQTLVVLKRDP